ISINETLIVQLISFLIFLFIINRIMIRPLRKVMIVRDGHVDRVVREIVESKKKIIDYRQQIEDHERVVKKEMQTLNQDLETAGKKEAKEIIESARKEITVIKDGITKEINEKIKEAKKSLDRETESLADSIMEKVLERRVS
ncbi:MAG: hypothetical protein A2V65_00355, partial [Deltaproteobacteria bacterium RBG_13_49_15]